MNITVTICPHAVDLTARRCALCDDTLRAEIAKLRALCAKLARKTEGKT